MIDRTLKSPIVIFLDHFPVVGIIGPRQVGKTTLAKDIQKSFSKKSHYLDLELPSDENRLRDPELYFADKEDDLIIIDEIQRKPELFPFLRAWVDRTGKNGQLIILGSASPNLLRRSSESLAGRIIYQELHPIQSGEISSKDIDKLWMRGGFPRSFLSINEEMGENWRQSFIQSYLERDLPALGLPTSPARVRRLLTMASSVQGQILNYSLLSKSLGVSVNNLKNQIDFLEDSFLMRRLGSFHINTKKRLVKSPKLYIRDTGILHTLLGIREKEELFGHIQLGSSWETFVIHQIVSTLDTGYIPHYYRTQDGSELDLLICRGNRPVVAIEIKHSKAPKLSRGNNIAFSDVNAPHNFVIIPGDDLYSLKKNVKVVGIERLEEVLNILK